MANNVVPLHPTGLSGVLPATLASTWTVDQPVPAAVIAQLPVALDEAEAMMRPIAPKDLYVLLTRTLMLWKLPEDWNDIAPFYREALEDCPRDLVEAGLKHARLTSKWFPKPCELREPFQAELERRRGVLLRLRTMELRAKLGQGDVPEVPPMPSVEEKAAVTEMAAEARRILATAACKRVPAAKDDDRSPAADPYRAARLALPHLIKPAASAPASGDAPSPTPPPASPAEAAASSAAHDQSA